MNTELFDIKIRAVEGGVTAAAGFKAAGIRAGFRKNPERLDYALVVPDKPCPGAFFGMYSRSILPYSTLSRCRRVYHQSLLRGARTGEPCQPGR